MEMKKEKILVAKSTIINSSLRSFISGTGNIYTSKPNKPCFYFIFIFLRFIDLRERKRGRGRRREREHERENLHQMPC